MHQRLLVRGNDVATSVNINVVGASEPPVSAAAVPSGRASQNLVCVAMRMSVMAINRTQRLELLSKEQSAELAQLTKTSDALFGRVEAVLSDVTQAAQAALAAAVNATTSTISEIAQKAAMEAFEAAIRDRDAQFTAYRQESQAELARMKSVFSSQLKAVQEQFKSLSGGASKADINAEVRAVWNAHVEETDDATERERLALAQRVTALEMLVPPTLPMRVHNIAETVLGYKTTGGVAVDRLADVVVTMQNTMAELASHVQLTTQQMAAFVNGAATGVGGAASCGLDDNLTAAAILASRTPVGIQPNNSAARALNNSGRITTPGGDGSEGGEEKSSAVVVDAKMFLEMQNQLAKLMRRRLAWYIGTDTSYCAMCGYSISGPSRHAICTWHGATMRTI